jgi:hypothetical protein
MQALDTPALVVVAVLVVPAVLLVVLLLEFFLVTCQIITPATISTTTIIEIINIPLTPFSFLVNFDIPSPDLQLLLYK